LWICFSWIKESGAAVGFIYLDFKKMADARTNDLFFFNRKTPLETYQFSLKK